MRLKLTSFLTIALSLGGAHIASAADMPVKAPMAAVWSWTGFYIGGNVGYGWGNGDLSLVPGPGWAAFGNPATDPGYLVANGSPNLKLRGALGGAQVGYNFQLNNFVLGAEADFSFAGIDGGRTTGFIAPPPGALIDNRAFNESDRLQWLATFRGRLGYAAQSFLIYATGGLAVGRHEFSQTIFNAGNFNTNAGSVNTTKTGWTVGGGVEAKLAGNWTAKAEYLYVDLGSVSVFSDSNTAPGFGLTVNTSSKLTANILRAGLNYHF
ncbi:porin family protein [Bradyrhizobium sediminis]|uniref:Porin family protein n=1 Tax=Bradyrhizobium sediminis TaxID=2840469 RepID=A0A975RVD5_9BRAD|nr:outer membrane protein [Bradyrhizobium sediminis]QWG22032.1 porin family protein [Bradyrhizobium sediminis]